jgi:hypothetical protein
MIKKKIRKQSGKTARSVTEKNLIKKYIYLCRYFHPVIVLLFN